MLINKQGLLFFFYILICKNSWWICWVWR